MNDSSQQLPDPLGLSDNAQNNNYNTISADDNSQSGVVNASISQNDNQQSDNSQPGSSQTSVQTNSPAIADDVELIEKEWVVKAKEVVEKTKDNPYLQNKAISEMKADYIKKRYNKDLTKSD